MMFLGCLSIELTRQQFNTHIDLRFREWQEGQTGKVDVDFKIPERLHLQRQDRVC